MAQAAEKRALSIAPRYQRPPAFGGTDVAWRVLCDLYPSAETPEVVMAVVEYCAARHLDPLRRPVHIIPMWNSRVRRRVQVVIQGINELETTAHRTGLWAGMDMPVFGPIERRKFKGQAENEDGSKREVEVEVEFPEWCAVTVHRLVAGEKRAFTEPAYWMEAYGRASFRSAVPNARWTQAPRQMLHKVAKAAALRAAFPEEVGYSADEMEDREIDAGGVTLDGHVDHGDAGLTDRDRRIETYSPASPPTSQWGGGGGETSQPPGDPRTGLEVLDDTSNGTRWLKALTALLAGAATLDDLLAIERHPNVVTTLDPEAEKKPPTLILQTIRDAIKKAHDRIVATVEEPSSTEDPPDDWPDPIAELIAEVDEMDLIRLNALATDAAWRKKVREAAEFPPDEDRLNDAIAARKATFKGR